MKEQDIKASKEESDEALLRRVQAGEDALFDVVSERYRDRLFRYILRYVQSPDAAEDVLQDVLIKSHKNIAAFDPTRKFSSWIYTIAHNEAVTFVTAKRTKSTVSLERDVFSQKDQQEFADASLASLERWFQQELRDEMHAAIAQLPQKYQEIIRMRFLEELSYQEMSARIDKPVNTVGTLVRRAKKRLLEIVLAKEE